MVDQYIKRILQARVYDVAIESPIHDAPRMSQRLGNTVFLKREDLQPVFSFKLRGAYNKIAGLSKEQKKRGVIAASAGNHAQGVALAAKELGISATIVMPQTTPDIKVSAVRANGARVVLHGDAFPEAFEHSQGIMRRKKLFYVHPYDDPDVIAGQGTVGMEIMRQVPGQLDALFVPVGGGGLLAGVCAYVKYVRPSVKIYSVEAEDSACFAAAMRTGRRVVLPQVGIFADGVAVAQIGKEPFRVAKNLVDGTITVTTDEICAAIKDIFDDTRSIAEPSGAIALAGLKKHCQEHKLKKARLLAVVSGANVNFDRLRHVSERAELGEMREALLAVTIPEKPGSFLGFCKTLGKRAITEFNYRYNDSQSAKVFAGVQIDSARGRQLLLKELKKAGFSALDMTDNEVAKLHIRHMVGGPAPGADDEVLYRFQFPERPGALLAFLSTLGTRWNISMFHYRNHGAAYGRVLVGLQVPPREKKELEGYLTRTGYRFWEETGNPAYDLFLS